MEISDAEIKMFIRYPHLLGNYLGYTLLSEIHSKWIWDCWIRNTDYALQAHRNSYKTTAILVVGAIWHLLFVNPNEQILFIRKSLKEASKTVKEIKTQYESEPLRYLYKEILGIDKLRGDTWGNLALSLVTKTRITAQPNISCLGIGGSITGTHFSKIFSDDIITLKDRISRAERETTILFIKELINIVTIDGCKAYTGTPWHPEDGWKNIPDAVKYPVGSIAIKGFTPEKLQEYKSQLGASLYASNYELKHISDENKLFGDPVYVKWPDKFKIVASWLDPSYEGAATTALSMIGITIENLIYVRGWVWPAHVVDCYTQIVDCCNQYHGGSLYVETNADKGFSKRDLAALYPIVIGKNETANKHIKIVSFVKYNWSKLLFAEDCQPEYMSQVLDYTEDADLKDAADSLASLIRELKIGGSNILERFGI